VVLLILTVQIADIRLLEGGAVTGVGAWLSAASGYFVYRAALYLRRGEAFRGTLLRVPRFAGGGDRFRKRGRKLLRNERLREAGRRAPAR